MKVYTAHEVLESTKKKLAEVTAERDALAAQVEALRKMCMEDYELHLQNSNTMLHEYIPSAVADWAERSLPRAPECLAELQAEAGRAGFVEGARQATENETGWFGNDVEKCANQYAERIRREGK